MYTHKLCACIILHEKMRLEEEYNRDIKINTKSLSFTRLTGMKVDAYQCITVFLKSPHHK